MQDLAIDITKLEYELARHVDLACSLYNQLAEATIELRELEWKRKLLHAEISDDARQNPAKYNISKVTIDAVESTVLRHPDYVNLVNQCLEKQSVVDRLAVQEKIMRDRKDMLTSLALLLSRRDYRSMYNGRQENYRAKEGISAPPGGDEGDDW